MQRLLPTPAAHPYYTIEIRWQIAVQNLLRKKKKSWNEKVPGAVLANVLGEQRNKRVPIWDMSALAFPYTNFSFLHLELKLKLQGASTILDLKTTDWNLTREDVAYAAQIYDGAAGVSGVLNGGQELFRQPHPYAIMHVFASTHIF